MRTTTALAMLSFSCSGEPVPTYTGAHAASKPAPPATTAVVVRTTTPPAPTGTTATAEDGPCKTTCAADQSSALTPDDTKKVATAITPMMRDLRGCLARVGAQNIRPVVFARFAENGKPDPQPRVDVGGYENLACVADARAKTIEATTSHGALVRCEQRCD
jgi:hypothetical protein